MQVDRSLWLDSRPGQVEFLVRGVTAPQRTVFQPPIWELSNRSGVGGAPLSTVLRWVNFGVPRENGAKAPRPPQRTGSAGYSDGLGGVLRAC